MTLSPELQALRDEAMVVTCWSWSSFKGWKLSNGIDRCGPCPNCGGTDRFAIHTGKNTFNCRQCGISGSGVIDLVMKTESVGFVDACEIITGRKASEPVDPERAARIAAENAAADRRRQAEAERYREQARQAGWAIWTEAANASRDGIGTVSDYLALRGIELSALPVPASEIRLLQHPDLPLVEEVGGVWTVLHRGPAMIAALRRPDWMLGDGAYGRFGAVHMTWLDLGREKGKVVLPPHPESGKEIAAKKMRGSMKGCAIRLYTPPRPRRLVMGEGIETTLTALAHNFEPDTAYWAAGSLVNMSGKAARGADGRLQHGLPDMDDLDCFLPPDWCEEVVYLCDSDEANRHTVEKVTRGLLRAQAVRDRDRAAGVALPALECALVEPLGEGKDLNDLVRVINAAGSGLGQPQ